MSSRSPRRRLGSGYNCAPSVPKKNPNTSPAAYPRLPSKDVWVCGAGFFSDSLGRLGLVGTRTRFVPSVVTSRSSLLQQSSLSDQVSTELKIKTRPGRPCLYGCSAAPLQPSVFPPQHQPMRPSIAADTRRHILQHPCSQKVDKWKR